MEMILLEEIETERGKVPAQLKEKYEKAKEEFFDYISLWNTSTELLKNLYSEADRYLKMYLENNEITCHRGCGYCCKQLICCTTLEMQLIVEYIFSELIKTQKKEIKKKLKKEATKFALWFSNNLGVPKNVISEPVRSHYFGKSCPFLKNEMCSIYPVRPIICRTTKVKGDFCGKHVPLGSSRTARPIKLFYDQVITDLLKEEQIRLYDKLIVMPVNIWPLSEEFKEYFF